MSQFETDERPDDINFDGGENAVHVNYFEKWEKNPSDIKLDSIVLGRGNFGVVYKGLLSESDGSLITVAAKEPSDALKTNEFLAEIVNLTSVQHENIIRVVGCCLPESRENGLPLLITEYMKYGDLLKFLWKAREADCGKEDTIYELSEADVCHIFYQVASGMEHLAKVKIIHGDLAARNILVGENLTCKISDFGLASDVYRYGIISGCTEKKIPWQWCAPERLMEGKVPITRRSDVWSFGMLMYEVVTLGSSPFHGVKKENLLKYIQAGNKIGKPPSCNSTLYGIMCRCWEVTPSKRPEFSELVKFFSRNKKEADYLVDERSQLI